MSMYNLMHGTNPFAALLVRLVGFTSPVEQIPRLRDCYVDADDNIVVFTRTGGGNRADYEEENRRLTLMPGYLRTEDWATDTTYAKWVYQPQERHRDMVRQLGDAGARSDPTEKFEALMADLRSNNPGPRGRAALERAQPLMDQIAAALQGEQKGGVIMVDAPEEDKLR
jgi:hypothetical protein